MSASREYLAMKRRDDRAKVYAEWAAQLGTTPDHLTRIVRVVRFSLLGLLGVILAGAFVPSGLRTAVVFFGLGLGVAYWARALRGLRD